VRLALVVAVGGFADAVQDVDDPEAAEPFGRLEFTAPLAAEAVRILARLSYRCDEDGALIDVDRDRLQRAVESAIRHPVSAVVVHFIGHGATAPINQRYYLAALNTRQDALEATGVDVCAHLDAINASPDGPPVLFVLDACQAGRAVRYLQGQDRHDQKAWVLAATHPHDPAIDGRFSQALLEVLTQIADKRVDLTPSEQFVHVNKLRDLVQENLDRHLGLRDLRQVVECTTPSTQTPAPPFVPNPHFNPTLAEVLAQRRQIVPETAARTMLDEVTDASHFRSRASGLPHHANQSIGGVGLTQCLFTGRAGVLAALVAWLEGSDTQPGELRVLTGSPGSGKSAVLDD
jgi:Caspase domain